MASNNKEKTYGRFSIALSFIAAGALLIAPGFILLITPKFIFFDPQPTAIIFLILGGAYLLFRLAIAITIKLTDKHLIITHFIPSQKKIKIPIETIKEVEINQTYNLGTSSLGHFIITTEGFPETILNNMSSGELTDLYKELKKRGINVKAVNMPV